MKKYSFLFPIASLCWCLFGCNEDSGFGFPEGDVENVVPQQGDIVSMPMNTEDSAFFLFFASVVGAKQSDAN